MVAAFKIFSYMLSNSKFVGCMCSSNLLLIFVHVFFVVFSWCSKGIFLQPFLGVIRLNLIILLSFELDQLSLLLNFEFDQLLLLLSLELD